MRRSLRKDEDSRDTSKLESLEQRIYSTDNPVFFKDRRTELHSQTGFAKTSWQEIQEEEPKEASNNTESSFFKKFSHRVFYTALTFFLIISIYSAYAFYFSTDSVLNNKIGFEIQTPSYIDGGREFPVDIYVTNENKSTMERVDIVIEYPKGESITSLEDTVVKRIALGDIKGGTTAKGLGDMVLYGREGSLRTIKAYAEFYSPGSSVVRKKDISKTISLRSAPVVLLVESLKETPTNTEVAYTIKVRAERGVDIDNFIVQVTYPNGFQYTRASEETRSGNNTWFFDRIEKGTEKSITLYGKIRGENDDERVFRVAGGSENIWSKGQIGIVYADTKSSIVIKKPFISITGNFSGSALTSTGEFVIRPSGEVEGTLMVRNNVPDTVSAVVVEAKLSGEILNRNKIVVQDGYFDSVRNTIVWNQTTKKSLKQILPGDEVELSFSFESYDLNLKQGAFFSEPKITIEPQVRAKRLSDKSVPEIYSSSNPLIARVMTQAGVVGKVIYQSSPFEKSGPFPPQVEKTTSYALELELLNKSNPLKNAIVSFVLPPYVEYAGAFSPEDKNIKYDPDSRQVTWEVTNVLPGTGYGLHQEKVYISLKVTPSNMTLGSKLDVPGIVYLKGVDSFTETEISSKFGPIKLEEKVQ